MVDQNAVEVVRNIFRDKARCHEMFTSVDITKQTGDISHRFVRDALHELWSAGEITSLDYTRTLERMHNGQEAYVYGPRGVPASHYTNRGQTLDPATTGSDDTQYAPPITKQQYIDTMVGFGKEILKRNDAPSARFLSRHTRSDGAIEIPGVLVSKINASNGDQLYGYFDDAEKELVISPEEKAGKSNVPFHVYRTGETRVPKKLVSTFFPGQDNFCVRIRGKELRIS